MRTREALLPDAEQIHDLIAAYSHDGTLLPRTFAEVCENVRDFVVLEDHGHIIGCGALHLYGPHLAEIRSITVDPARQGSGGGERLVKALLAQARNTMWVLWPQLKAELLGDERSYRTLGLRPRIVYRGRDLFAPGPVAMSVTADAEAGFAAALSRLAGATHRALAQRIAKASAAGFERLIHAYLVAAGYREIAWVKRVGGISYAAATAPGLERTVLISARSGDQPIDRRGIGELRVGVEAKNLVAGILFSARELSEDAERELERAGRSIAVVCGDQLVAALIARGRRRRQRGGAAALRRRSAPRRAARGLAMLAWHWLGRADYRRVLADQLAARERVWAGGEGVVYLCEHPPVITLGRSANRAQRTRRGRRSGRSRSSAAATSRITAPAS